MAQHSHVPKFGNWDGDNVPYTVYFENARKEKGSVRMNPNDPEENPEAFMFGAGGATFSHSVQHQPPQNNAQKSTLTASSQVEGRNVSQYRHKNSSQKSITSESTSEKSNSDNSIHLANHRRTRSDRKKSINEGSSGSSIFSPSPGPNRMKSGSSSNPLTDTPLRAASVPMFGAWDESDPKSGEGFTVIFNKVKEEKHIAATTFPPIPPQLNNQTSTHKTDSKSSKRCCCLF